MLIKDSEEGNSSLNTLSNTKYESERFPQDLYLRLMIKQKQVVKYSNMVMITMLVNDRKYFKYLSLFFITIFVNRFQ